MGNGGASKYQMKLYAKGGRQTPQSIYLLMRGKKYSIYNYVNKEA